MYICHLIGVRQRFHSFIKLVDLLSVFLNPYSVCAFLSIKGNNKMSLFSSMMRFNWPAYNKLQWLIDLKGITSLWNFLLKYSSVLPHRATYKIKVSFLFRQVIECWISFSFKIMILTSPSISIFLFSLNEL